MDNLTGTASILWRGKYLVAAGLVAGIAVAIATTRLSSKVYESSVIVQVQSDASSRSGDVLGLQQASQGLATTYATLMSSRSFLARIRPQIEGGRYSTDELASRLGAGAISQSNQSTNLIELTAQGPSPRSAQALGDSVAQAFVSTVEHDAAARAEQQQTELQSRIGALTGQINRLLARTRPSRLSTIAEQLASLRAARAAVTTEMATAIANGVARQGSVAIVGPSTEPGAPIKPRPLLNGLVGVALGLMLGICLAWIRNLLDRHLHRSEEVPELVDLPVLASIPLWRGASTDELVAREGYDVLRTNLAFFSPGKPPSVLVVTSYESGEGKTSTAEGLARAAAGHGDRVLVIDGDLRTRALSGKLGCLDEPGLVNVVVSGGDDPGEVAMNDHVRELEPGLFVLPAGPPPPNPPGLLANPRMATLVWQLRFNFDLIVVDAPPVGRLADAAILAGMADASIVISRVGRTKKADLVAAVEALKRTPTPTAGVVVFERRSLDSAYYPAGGNPQAVDLLDLRPVAPPAERRPAKQS